MRDFQKGLLAVTLVVLFLCYSVYIYSHLPVEHPVYSLSADEGKMAWQKHNCTACHQVYGLGGYLGPDLTNEFSRRTPEQIKGLIRAGNRTMPAYALTDQELNNILAYLQQVNQTGQADPKTYSIQRDGTIRQ